MEYLFFDIECANCDGGEGKICSFGYVLTDTSFSVIEKEDIIIDPNAPFHLRGYGKGQKSYIELAYTEEIFRAAPRFPHFYDRISALLSRPDTLIFGFAPENDAAFLASEFERYELPFVDFEFCDVQRIFKRHIKDEGGNQFSLVRACEYLGIATPETVHKSVDDAVATMGVLKRICAEEGRGAPELMVFYTPCTGALRNGELDVSYFKKKVPLEPWELNMMKGINEDNFKKLIKRTKWVRNARPGPIRGKVICISDGYEYHRYHQMCMLVPLVAEAGGRITRKVKECDIFVSGTVRKRDNKFARCIRMRTVNELKAAGYEIQVVSLHTFLHWLHMTEEQLDEISMPIDMPIDTKVTDDTISLIVGTEHADDGDEIEIEANSFSDNTEEEYE